MAMARNLILTVVCLLSAISLISTFILGTRTVDETTEEVINALSNSNFDDWSPAFISTNNPILGKTLPSTLFIPLSANVHGGDPRNVTAYHIVPERLRFAELVAKKDGTLLPTLLPGLHIILSNSSTGLTLDGVDIVEPDVFVDSVMAVHRVASPLDFGKYGNTIVGDEQLQNARRPR
ncbi:hypothetical protein V5N11_006887 [Cardamine amara subsp. amara]|uniref:FAS1 domain-containing protein n=1 Tax=Cardamine amara subsp. amara TaxID=228776 RepID=A0ABD1AUZ3_CARAN